MFDPKRTVELVKNALIDPEPTWHSYLNEAGDWKKTAVELTAPLIVVSAVVAYLLGFLGGGPFGIRPTIASTLLSIIGGGIVITIVTFIFSGMASLFGGKHDFARGLAATTLAFVPGYVGQALSTLPWIGWIVSIGFLVYALVLLWRIIPIYLEVPAEKRAPHYSLSLIASVVAIFVISAMLGGGRLNRAPTAGLAAPASAMLADRALHD